MTFEEYIEELKKDEKNKDTVTMLENAKTEKSTIAQENEKLRNEVNVLKSFFANVKTVKTEEEKKKEQEEDEKKLFKEMLANL